VTPQITQAEESLINRVIRAHEKHARAAGRLDAKPGVERFVYREQHTRIEEAHARLELTRKMKMWAWNEGHDLCCDFGTDCQIPEHENPYIADNFFADAG
jgi:hypothetical protein